MSNGEGGRDAGVGAAGGAAGGAFGGRAAIGVSEGDLRLMQERHARWTLPRARVLWSYFRNAPAVTWWREAARGLGADSGARWASERGGPGALGLAQERGLPPRLRDGGAGGVLRPATGARPRDVVIENDIAWRVQAMVDFLFNRPIRIVSRVGGAGRAGLIERVLEAVWEASGGAQLLQDAALIGHVHGSVDLIVRWVGEDAEAEESGEGDAALVRRAARCVRIEIIEPSRGMALLDAGDYRKLRAFAVRLADGTMEVIGRTHRGRVVPGRDGERARVEGVGEHGVGAGRVPVVHVQNLSQPFSHEGLSEVEPLIPLQDELNTRLSDRANRVALQSFKMYLVKCVDGFEQSAVGPGTVWATDNPEASITAFGGDEQTPGEESHIAEIRDAMDKQSGVPPLAAGLVRAKIGNLTSENALRIVLQGLLTRTARKRLTYGRGIMEVNELVLAALDAHGVIATMPSERATGVDWPDPLPTEERVAAEAARIRADLGEDPGRALERLNPDGREQGVE
ncbi:MAG: phage portal protein [Planctomyces sp.]